MTKPATISSGLHPLMRHIAALRRRDYRETTRLYYGEGVRFFIEAVRHQAPIETIVVCPTQFINPLAQKLLEQQRELGTTIVEVSPAVLRVLAKVGDPQGIGAVVRQKWQPLEKVKLGGKLCWLGVERVQSPGNLGTIMRTSAAVGAAGLILLGDAADPYDPAVVRASMGAIFKQRFARTTTADLAAWKAARGWSLIGTSPAAPAQYDAVAYPHPAILLLGWERQGLSPELQAMCDLLVRIPMVGRVDSLNIAVAAGIVLYELFKQRQ